VRVVFAIAAAVLALDIASKAIVVAALSGRAPVRLLGGLLTLLLTRNPGVAFSLGGSSETIVFTAIAVGVVIFIIRTSRRIYSAAWAVALGLLLGGAAGNLTDRIFRSPGPFRGWVVDWIQLPHWPVFNLADSAISCGGVLMVLLAFLGRSIEGNMRTAAGGPAGQPARPSDEPAGPADQPAGLAGGQPDEADQGQPGDAAPRPPQGNATRRGR
jgi:lipoprotein signal peptidase